MASPLTQFTTSVNFVLGAGVLGLPYAMASAGILVSAASLLAVALLSFLTCSWLLEVGDRSNALQNEMARVKQVSHADGGTSLLPPAASFCACRKPGSLREPLLQRGEKKLDEYRAAYRSWRQGSHQGARDSQLRQLMPLLVYQPRKHRELLPLQLLPPPRQERASVTLCTHTVPTLDITMPTPFTHRAHAVRTPSTFDEDAEVGPSAVARFSLESIFTGRHPQPQVEGAPPTLKRTNSFSVDLASALMALPARYTAVDEEEGGSSRPSGTYGGYAPPPMEGSTNDPPPPPAATPTSVRSLVHSPVTPKLHTPPALRTPPVRWASTSARAWADEAPDWSIPDQISALEVAQLCTLFLGWRSRSVWFASICALHLVAMWACCAIWITCFHTALTRGAHAAAEFDGTVELLLCALVLLPLCAIDGMGVVQPFLAAATLTTIAAMILLLGWALAERFCGAADQLVFDLPHGGAAAAAGAAGAFEALVFNRPQFGAAFATFLFSHIVQQSVPSLMRTSARPETTRAALGAAILTCCALYLLLGCEAALYFGPEQAHLITLNFQLFRGGAPRGQPPPLWAQLVANWIMLLPLLTTTAAFPLFNGVLASNLVAILPSWLRSRRIASTLCALPPLVLTALVRDTAFLFSLCGLSGFAIVFFIPAALQHASRRTSIKRWGKAGVSTPHSTIFSGTTPVFIVVGLASVAFAFNVWVVLLSPVLSALSVAPWRQQ
ncbi:hypothetical protein AB1Y20_012495 [Prymnesium parvum]|uniref:Amino acid transporter transmembrane domain-containing protein n=1 Tax=Prymnesium parvum TaxID=97485 RepID=A0AB34IIW2_PRYPA